MKLFKKTYFILAIAAMVGPLNNMLGQNTFSQTYSVRPEYGDIGVGIIQDSLNYHIVKSSVENLPSNNKPKIFSGLLKINQFGDSINSIDFENRLFGAGFQDNILVNDSTMIVGGYFEERLEFVTTDALLHVDKGYDAVSTFELTHDSLNSFTQEISIHKYLGDTILAMLSEGDTLNLNNPYLLKIVDDSIVFSKNNFFPEKKFLFVWDVYF